MSRLHWILLGVFLAIAALALLGVTLKTGRRSSIKPSVPTAVVVRADFSKTIDTIGEVDASISVPVVCRVRGSGHRLLWLVANGESVDAGDVVARLDPSALQDEYEDLQTRLSSAEAQFGEALRQVEFERERGIAERDAAQLDVNLARMELRSVTEVEIPRERGRLRTSLREAQARIQELDAFYAGLQKLQEDGVDLAADVRATRQALAEATREHEEIGQELQTYESHTAPLVIQRAEGAISKGQIAFERAKQNATDSVEVVEFLVGKARREVATIRASLTSAEAEIAQTLVRSPAPGIVVLREELRDGSRRPLRSGDAIYQGQVLMTVPDLRHMVVNTYVRESEFPRVSLDVLVEAYVDAFPGEVFNGRVESVGVLAERVSTQFGVLKRFSARVVLDDRSQRLRPGMTARLLFLTGSFDDALVVPELAVHTDAGTSWCYLQNGSVFGRVDISVLGCDQGLCAIAGEVAVGDIVALTRPGQM